MTKPVTDRQPGDRSVDSPAKKKRGAQPGNTNSVKHLLNGRLQRREERDSHKRAAERMVRQMLKSAGLQDDPTAKMVGKQIRRLESVASRMEAHLDHRGHFDRKGDLKSSVGSYIGVVDKLLGEARRLLEKMGSLQPNAPRGSSELVSLILASQRREQQQRGEAAKATPRGIALVEPLTPTAALSEPQIDASEQDDDTPEHPEDVPSDAQPADEAEPEPPAPERAAAEAAEPVRERRGEPPEGAWTRIW